METLKNIEMMNGLLKKSEEIRKNQTKETQLTKEEMLLRAKNKIQKYFEGVIRVLPFKSHNVTIDGLDVLILLRKGNEEPKDKFDALSNKNLDLAIIVVNHSKTYSSEYHVVHDKYVGYKWGSSGRLKELSEKSILTIAKNFDEVKRKIEDSISREIEKHIKVNADNVKKEANNLDVLSSFLEVQ
jgi:hypothetical protein